LYANGTFFQSSYLGFTMRAITVWWTTLFSARWLPSLWFAKRNTIQPEQPAAADKAQAVTPVAPQTTTDMPLFGARRPLIDEHGELAGFEFRLAPAVAQRLAQQSDNVAIAAHATALLLSMRATIAAGRTALIALPITLLSRPAVLAAVPRGVWLAITDADQPAMQTDRAFETLTALNRAGAKLGGVGHPRSGCDFVVLDATNIAATRLVEDVTAIRALCGEINVVVTGIGSIGDLELLLNNGINLAAGIVDTTTTVLERTPMSPRLQQICRLIHHVVSDEDLVETTRVLRSEVELSYQILRQANSATNGLTRPVNSVDHAAFLMGRDGLYQWLTMLLLTGGRGRATSRALREIALSRARLLEMLAGHDATSTTSRSTMFTLGLLSLLDVMLQTNMADALDNLPLAPALRAALVEKSGDLHPALELVQALERSDLACAADLAWPYGGLHVVIAESDEAWRWAAEAVRR
jgi:EAL and modified HD-GYP domain-containing signal transduction protein